MCWSEASLSSAGTIWFTGSYIVGGGMIEFGALEVSHFMPERKLTLTLTLILLLITNPNPVEKRWSRKDGDNSGDNYKYV